MTKLNVVCQRGEHFTRKILITVSGDEFEIVFILEVFCSNVNFKNSFEFHRRFSLKMNFNISH